MRTELRQAFGGVIAGVTGDGVTLTDDESETLLGIANIVTAARTGVERDRRGEVVDAHAFEAPTRLVKYLGQVVRGGVAIGMDRDDAMRLAVRIAHDCVPPLRMAALRTVAANPGNTTSEIARLMDKPRSSVDRALQELHLLDLLTITSDSTDTRWRYRVATEVDEGALTRLLDGSRVFTRKATTHTQEHKEGTDDGAPDTAAACTPTGISGDFVAAALDASVYDPTLFPDLGPPPDPTDLPLSTDDVWQVTA
jgi:DNA-binding MarR family transcriptional regulator